MKLPDGLIERIANRIVDELGRERVIEVEDPELFKKKIIAIFKEAAEEERKLEERTKEILKDKLDLIEESNLDYRSAFRAVKAKLAEEMNININRRERMNQIANRLRDLIMEDDTVEIYEDPPIIRRRILTILREALQQEQEIEMATRKRIKERFPTLLEGSPEWNILYKRIYEDELKRRGLA